MRFSQYKGILDLLDSVVEATEYMLNNKTDQLCEICVQSLESVLNTLKTDNPECIDVINDVTAAIQGFEEKTYENDDFIEKLNKLNDKAKTEIKYRLRILFVAELGGKWDSMASVYKAFIERDDCDVDVVLEPVFREVKYTDGSTKREVIYKDWLTPLGIKHILYDHYDMAKIRPDVTFLCQPYESCTLPMFWPVNIVKYSKLVYLTYGSAYSLHPDIQPAFDHFFRFNTERLSWKIPCQSDQMKEHYQKYATNKGENVIATGIAKWDYPLGLSKERVSCPEEWKEKIKDRKVFLWNTHFTISKPENGSKIFTPKGMEFLKIFRENKDIALIWRPHPMTLTVLKMYTPQLLETYNKLVKIVSESDNMVYDTSEGYDAAFVWSDALITDISTMIDQYLLLKKPVLLNLSDKSVVSKFEDSRSDNLLDFMSLDMAFSIDDIKAFINNIDIHCKNILDSFEEKFGQYYQYADGHAGERIVDNIIESFKVERDE